jgi:hypothetical protein
MSASTSSLLLPFLTATAHLRASAPACPYWLLDRVAERDKGVCWFCGTHTRRSALLFSPLLGGSRTEANTVLCCDRCRVTWADLDPLTTFWSDGGKGWTERKTIQRFDALADCLQHAVSPAHRRSVASCRASLEKLRWFLPRVPVSVLCTGDTVLLALASAKPSTPWGTLTMTAKAAGAVAMQGAPTVLSVPVARWPSLAWSLIEQGALLRRVTVDGVVSAGETSGDPHGEPAGPGPWDELFQSVRSAARGREALPHSGFPARALGALS